MKVVVATAANISCKCRPFRSFAVRQLEPVGIAGDKLADHGYNAAKGGPVVEGRTSAEFTHLLPAAMAAASSSLAVIRLLLCVEVPQRYPSEQELACLYERSPIGLLSRTGNKF